MVTAALKLKDTCSLKGFPGGSAGKESACNAGDLGLIPGLGRSPGEGNGYSLQYYGFPDSLVNNPPAVQETPVQFLCWEDPLEEGIGYPLQDSWVSLVAQLGKNLPAMWKTWVQSLGWEDPLERRKATHSSILA